MVAISLYRGNLHRVPPDVPRRWLMPTPKISLKDFRTLLVRRSRALSLLPSSSSSAAAAAAGNPNPSSLPQSRAEAEDSKANENPNFSSENGRGPAVVAAKAEDDSAPLDRAVAALIDGGDTAVAVEARADEERRETEDGKEKEKEKEKEKGELSENPAMEQNNQLDAVDEEKEKRRREVEEKLKILNEKKHNLVQALKQILNAEEELKRRSNTQASRPPLPLQLDASNDSGSMTRHATPRTGSDANVAVDMEVGEGDDALNQNPQSRQLVRMSSTSPSAESALRRAPYFQHNVVSHTSRAAVAVAGSPSRFAPTGNQGNTTNLPTVSVSGTNYIMSSPSPAASGGTSGFRDARHPSPWS